ncbi:MAG TPA: phosphopantetheine-binding protein [Pyrinomonadaceae bacterium]|nr:phosphopantetheine-binding protein [Pyrinomonadaceae bacterium]
MPTEQTTDQTVMDILWQSLAGGRYNVEELKSRARPDSRFDELGLDSLDVVDFFLRIQDHFNVRMREQDYTDLTSVEAVQTYVNEKQAMQQ